MILVAVVASIPFLGLLVFAPVLRRLAFRNALRRPRETALVVAGSLLGTAILTASFIVGDTLQASLRQLAFTQLGPVDQVVTVADPAQTQEARRRIEALGPQLIDGVLQMSVLNVAVATTGQTPRAAPRAQLIEIDFTEAAALGPDPAQTGISGPTPAAGSVVMTRDLARTLSAGPGDTIEVHAYGTAVSLTVDRVLDKRGIAGFWLGFETDALNVFAAPGTSRQLADHAIAQQGVFAAAGVAAQGPRDVLAVSHPGGVIDSATHIETASPQLHATLDGLGATIRPAKREVLDAADAAGAQFSTLFTAMGSFGVVAGILLLVNIFVMLAEERRSELGMLRAVGLRRSRLIAGFATEGWLYAIASSALGALIGVGLGRLLAIAAATVFAGSPGQFRVELTFAATPASIQLGFTLGFLIAMGTIVATSIRISRFNVIQAIRDISEPVPHRPRARTLVAASLLSAAGVAWLASAIPTADPFGMLLAPIVVVAGVTAIVSRRIPRRLAVSAGAMLVIAWGVTGIRFFRDATSDATLMLFVAQGIVLTGAAVVLVSQNQEVLGEAFRRLTGGGRALAVRLGLAYPLARPFRTSMTLAMYTLVIFTLTFITVFSSIVSRQITDFAQHATGGFDVVVLSNPTDPLDPAQLQTHPGVDGVAPLYTTLAQFQIEDSDGPEGATLSGYDERWIDLGAPGLSERGIYPTDEAAYRAVLGDPDLIIVNTLFLQDRRAPGPPSRRVDVGDHLWIIDPLSGQRREVTVAAMTSGSLGFQGALYGAPAAREMFDDRLVANPIYLTLASGDAQVVAAEISGAYVATGTEARSLEQMALAARSAELRLFGLIRGYLALGLVVGIAGLGVVMVRAVRERRRQIGVLRALGFGPATVRRAFLFESGFIALEGVVIGVALALVTSWSLVAMGDVFGGTLQWEVPVVAVLTLVAGTVAASLLATAAPAQAASRIRPAVALRVAD